MNLYIEIKNGQAINHPATEENLTQSFGSIPANWEIFVRVEPPILGVYETMAAEEPAYEKVNGVWTDVWHKRNMTAEEKTARQQRVITIFNNFREQIENWSTWTFDEAACKMVPPIPRPEPIEGVLLMWCGADNNWKEAPARPEGDYKFDFFAWNWVAI